MSTVTVYDDATERWRLIEADATHALAHLPECSIDAIVTDPPYGLGLGGSPWDSFVAEQGSPQAAFERWSRAWAAGALRVIRPGGHLVAFGAPRTFHRLVRGIEDAGFEIRDQLMWLYAQGVPKSRRLPGGLGTGLKPSFEPIAVARKPLVGTTAATLERFGTGTLNIDAARIGPERHWPANVVLSPGAGGAASMLNEGNRVSRLFFCAKATRAEREAGCDGLPVRSVPLYTGRRRTPRLVRNAHPTVKPLSLMRWLTRLVVPEDGVVLDPFTGSGSSGVAAVLEGKRFLGIEREGEYVDIACARLTHWATKEQP